MRAIAITIFLAVTFSTTTAPADTGEAGPAMLKMPYGARLMSLGTAFVGLADDPFYMDSNPAGGQANTYRISIIHQEWIEDVNHESLRFTMGFDSIFLGIGYTFLYAPFTHYDFYGEDMGDYNISQGFGTFNIGYIHNRFSVGTNLKFYHYNVPEELYAGQDDYVIAADFGVLYRTDILKTYIGPEPSMVFGASIKNIGKSLGNGFETLPIEVHLGASYKLSWLMLSTELAIPFYEPLYGSVGLEYNFRQTIFASAGITIKENPMLGLGLGVKWRDLYVYASYTPRMEFRNMFNVSVSYRFGETKKLKKDVMVSQLISEAVTFYGEHRYSEALEVIDQILAIERGNKIAKSLKKNVELLLELEKTMKKQKEKEIEKLNLEYKEKLETIRLKYEDEKAKIVSEITEDLIEKQKSEHEGAVRENELEYKRKLEENKLEYKQKLEKLQGKLELENALMVQREVDSVRKTEKIKSEHYAKGIELLTDNKYKEALNEFKTVSSLDRDYLSVDEYIQISEAAMKDPASYSKEVLGFYYSGLELYTQKEYEGAIITWKKVLEIDPYNKEARKGIKEAQQRLNELKKYGVKE